MQGVLTVFDALDNPLKALGLNEATSQYLLNVDYATGVFTYYTNSSSMVSGLVLSQTTLTMNSGTTQQLTVIVMPSNAYNPNLAWTTSDASVATVDSNGLVTAVAGGTCTITCTAQDGSGVSSTCEVTVNQLVTDITLNYTTLTLLPGNYQKLTATIAPANATNKKLTWTTSNSNVAEVMSNGGVEAVALGTCTITCTAQDGSGVFATCEVLVRKDLSGELSGHVYVDLDLPSGVLWAATNIGATNPEEYGDYFAWGETTTKNDYSWSTYRYGSLTKYNSIDELTELELEDDAATANWGGNWCMLTKEQIEELVNRAYTTTEWITQNGVYGCKVTSLTNGNSIFLPAAGGRYGSSLKNNGSVCAYWSRTLNTGWTEYAYVLEFTSSYISTDFIDRCYGRLVRAVRVQ